MLEIEKERRKKNLKAMYLKNLQNNSVNIALNNLFKFQVIQIDNLENDFYCFKDNKVLWRFKFTKSYTPKKYNKGELGTLDKTDMYLMRKRLNKCNDPFELYNKYYKAYSRESFINILDNVLTDILSKKDNENENK